MSDQIWHWHTVSIYITELVHDQVYKLPDLEYKFTRRRYGTRIFTWLSYRKPGGPWIDYSDPWPSIRIDREEIKQAFVRIRENRIEKESP